MNNTLGIALRFLKTYSPSNGIVKDEQWNYHLGKMYECVYACVCVISKINY